MIGTRLARLLRVSTVAAFSSALALAACGGAAGEAGGARSAEPRTDTEGPAPEPTSIEAAERDIARARAELAGADTRAPGSPRYPAEPSDPGRPAPPPEPAPPAVESSPSRRPSSAPGAPKASSLAAEDRCTSPCRAIASMRRAVTALCRMTGADDRRCVDAKHTLTDSETRVSACSC